MTTHNEERHTPSQNTTTPNLPLPQKPQEGPQDPNKGSQKMSRPMRPPTPNHTSSKPEVAPKIPARPHLQCKWAPSQKTAPPPLKGFHLKASLSLQLEESRQQFRNEAPLPGPLKGTRILYTCPYSYFPEPRISLTMSHFFKMKAHLSEFLAI